MPEIVLNFYCLNKLFKWSQKICKFKAEGRESQKFFSITRTIFFTLGQNNFGNKIPVCIYIWVLSVWKKADVLGLIRNHTLLWLDSNLCNWGFQIGHSNTYYHKWSSHKVNITEGASAQFPTCIFNFGPYGQLKAVREKWFRNNFLEWFFHVFMGNLCFEYCYVRTKELLDI